MVNSLQQGENKQLKKTVFKISKNLKIGSEIKSLLSIGNRKKWLKYLAKESVI